MPIAVKYTSHFNTSGLVSAGQPTGVGVAYDPTASTGAAAGFGHLADPSWPGSFTGGVNTTGFSATGGNTYSYWDFRGGVDVGSTGVAANNVTFRGCRFQFSANVSNQGNNSAAQCLLFGSNINFQYCTFQPFTSNYPTELTGAEVNGSPSTYVEYGKGYQYAMVGDGGFNTHIGDLLIDGCDFWGFGNALQLAGSTVAHPHIVQNSWFHHGADPFVENVTGNQFHNDCWLVNDGGYHGAQCVNNVMEIWGNTNLLAWQGTGAYNDSTITGNRFSGDQESISLSASGTSARITFTDNVFSTRIGRSVGSGRPLRDWAVSDSGTGSLWRRNTYLVAAGASTGNYPAANWGSPSWNGLYWHPGDDDSTGGHASDYTG
jgi:hypothetical protein